MIERCRKVSVGAAIEIIVRDSGLTTAMFDTLCYLALPQWLAFGRTERRLSNATDHRHHDKGRFGMMMRCEAWRCSDAEVRRGDWLYGSFSGRQASIWQERTSEVTIEVSPIRWYACGGVQSERMVVFED